MNSIDRDETERLIPGQHIRLRLSYSSRWMTVRYEGFQIVGATTMWWVSDQSGNDFAINGAHIVVIKPL